MTSKPNRLLTARILDCVSNQEPAPASRVQRVLAYMIAAIVILSLVSFAALMVGYATGQSKAMSEGIWPTVFALPMFGLPIALLLTITLIIVTGVRRGRQNRA